MRNWEDHFEPLATADIYAYPVPNPAFGALFEKLFVIPFARPRLPQVDAPEEQRQLLRRQLYGWSIR